MSKHDHKLVVSLSSNVTGKVRHDTVIVEVRDEVESLLDAEFFTGAPFERIDVMIHYTTKTNFVPRFGKRIMQGYLEVNVDLAMSRVTQAQPDPPTAKEIYQIFKLMLLEVLVAVGQKYGLEYSNLMIARALLKEHWPYRSVAETLDQKSLFAEEEANISSESSPVTDMLRSTKDGLEYWKIWPEGNKLFIYEGIVGERGRSQKINLDDHELSNSLSVLIKGMESDGFKLLEEESLTEFIVQYGINDFGTEEEIARRHDIEILLNECLRWTGNGYCSGGDSGSDTMNIVCHIIDVEKAVETIINELKEHDYLENATLAHQGRDGEYIAVYPEDGQIHS